MNTQLKQVLINEIDESVSKGYFKTEEEAVEKALLAIREEEIMAKVELGKQQVRKGETSTFDKSFAEQVKAEIKAKLES